MDAPTLSSIVLLPAILMFFGGFVYLSAFLKGFNDEILPKYRLIGIGIFGLAVLIGLRYLWLMHNPSTGAFYQGIITSRKLKLAHYACFFLPLILLGAAFGAEKYHRRHLQLTR